MVGPHEAADNSGLEQNPHLPVAPIVLTQAGVVSTRAARHGYHFRFRHPDLNVADRDAGDPADLTDDSALFLFRNINLAGNYILAASQL